MAGNIGRRCLALDDVEHHCGLAAGGPAQDVVTA